MSSQLTSAIGGLVENPPPWKLVRREHRPFGVDVIDANGNVVLGSQPWSYSTDDMTVEKVDAREGNDKWLAVMRVFAAAPDLLAACKAMAKLAVDSGNPDAVLKMTEAAIAKAEARP